MIGGARVAVTPSKLRLNILSIIAIVLREITTSTMHIRLYGDHDT